MKCKNCPPRRKHGAKQSQPQDSLTENSSDVQVNNVIAQLQQQQALQTECLRRILEGRLEGADGAAGLVVALEGGQTNLEVSLGKS